MRWVVFLSTKGSSIKCNLKWQCSILNKVFQRTFHFIEWAPVQLTSVLTVVVDRNSPSYEEPSNECAFIAQSKVFHYFGRWKVYRWHSTGNSKNPASVAKKAADHCLITGNNLKMYSTQCFRCAFFATLLGRWGSCDRVYYPPSDRDYIAEKCDWPEPSNWFRMRVCVRRCECPWKLWAHFPLDRYAKKSWINVSVIAFKIISASSF